MTIRRTLLIYFLLMSLVPAVLVTALAFFQARAALQSEITQNLQAEASAVMEQVDRTLFERMGNVHTWSHLEVMQEIRIGDVDKRLSHFLLDLRTHYGEVYRTLFCTNRTGEIVASSDPQLIGRVVPGQAFWLTGFLPSGETYLEPLSLMPDGASYLPVRAPVDDVGQSTALGNLTVLFDWTEIFRLLDKSGHDSTSALSESLALLLDADGRVIAASAPLRKRGLLLSTRLASWRRDATQSMIKQDPDRTLGFKELLLASAASKGYQHFPGFGWSVLVAHPTAAAFAPIARMSLVFLLLIAITSVAAVLVSIIVAGKIGRPVTRLTKFTRQFMESQQNVLPPTEGVGEIRELTSAFASMIEDLQISKENLVRAAKLAVVGEMAAIMAHEVRTPLGILRSSAQMLKREPSLTDEGRELLSFLLSETERLNKLISTLLDCARPRPPMLRAVHLHPIIQRIIDMVTPQATRKNIRIVCKLGAAPDELVCDEEQLVQVFLNLLINPIQILPVGGEITVRTFSNAPGLVVEIDDDGPGIPEAERQDVFHPFFTRREGGVGLGLTVVQQIVQTHSGDIRVETGPDGGARFRLFFPQSRDSNTVKGTS